MLVQDCQAVLSIAQIRNLIIVIFRHQTEGGSNLALNNK